MGWGRALGSAPPCSAARFPSVGPASVQEMVTAFRLRADLAAPEPVTSGPDEDVGMPVEAGAKGANDGFREAGDSGGCGSDLRFLRGIVLGRGILTPAWVYSCLWDSKMSPRHPTSILAHPPNWPLSHLTTFSSSAPASVGKGEPRSPASLPNTPLGSTQVSHCPFISSRIY